jgi:acyl-CoA reductase-like NAD-dependent aldehyde dehydrogenase
MAREVGKPVDEAREDLESAIDSGRSDAEDAVRLSGEVTPSKFDDRLNFTRREPDGPAAVVTPWNYPVDHEAVRLVAFTGSTAVGQRIAASAAQRSVQAVLELGGEDPVLVLDDADLDRAADAIVTGSDYNCGQSCSGTERVIVTRGVDDEVVDRVTERTAGLVVGDPLDRSTDVGPPIDEDVRETVREQIADAVDAGARVTTGGTVGDRYCEPTVLADVTPDMRVPTEETFEPVRPILRVADVDEDHRRGQR